MIGFNKLLKGLGDFRGSVSDRLCNWLLGISHVSSLKEIVGDFSLINPYGVRVKGFPCACLGLRVSQSTGSGLRVFWGSGSGLRVRSPDDHVMLLIPLYLTGVCSLFPFPHPLIPSHH